MERLAGDGTVDLDHPSIAKALHDMAIAELLAHRLVARAAAVPPGDVGGVVAGALEYVSDLAATKHEGKPVTHGVVIATDHHGWTGPTPPLDYPGLLAERVRTPLLFDGTHGVLVVSVAGSVIRGVGRSDLPPSSRTTTGTDVFEDLTGLEGSLTAAASAVFGGIGVYVRPDQSIWVFDSGTPLLIRRTNRWKPIAIAAFARAVAELGLTSTQVADRVARAALRCSLSGSGALLAIAPDAEALLGQVPAKDLYSGTSRERPPADADALHRLITPDDIASPGALGRLAQLDGATIVDPRGELLAFGAIVRSTDSRAEGARIAAGRALSAHVNVAISVSQDGPITVFHRGEPVLRLL